jgi:hypothetical protein
MFSWRPEIYQDWLKTTTENINYDRGCFWSRFEHRTYGMQVYSRVSYSVGRVPLVRIDERLDGNYDLESRSSINDYFNVANVTPVENSTGSLIIFIPGFVLLTPTAFSHIPFQFIYYRLIRRSWRLLPSPTNKTHKRNSSPLLKYCTSHVHIVTWSLKAGIAEPE